MTKLTVDQCNHARQTGDFGLDVLGAAASVVVVLTQSWCPQWLMMRHWLEKAAVETGAIVFYVEYDRESFFEPFMAFKEDILGNRHVPYLRYYRNGTLVTDGNFIGYDGILRNLRLSGN
jgi:hypothetical protein